MLCPACPGMEVPPHAGQEEALEAAQRAAVDVWTVFVVGSFGERCAEHLVGADAFTLQTDL
jgi:hypothetical protein